MSRKSRYRSGPSDYDHRFHAGNVGDVFKHAVLGAWLRALQSERPLHVIDTHAGSGMFTVQSTGEWTAGIGKLDALSAAAMPALLKHYLTDAGNSRAPNRGGLYPGSPAFIRAQLRAEDQMTAVELADGPREKLAKHYTDDTQVTVLGGDGFKAALDVETAAAQRVIFIDPPYVQKSEWTTVAETIIALRAQDPNAVLMVWYPIKSLMRPQALVTAIQAAGLPGATVELISTPLKLRKKALNGSGLLIIGVPDGFLSTLGGVLPVLGEILSTVDTQEWTANLRSWRS